MMQNWFSKVSAIAFLLIGLFVLGHPFHTAHACTPTSATNPGPPPIQYTIQDKVTLAPIVLEGTVIVLNSGLTAQVEVHRYFKGDGPAIIPVMHYGIGSMCQAPLMLGGPIIIFASQWNTGDYGAYYFNGLATIPATEDNIQKIIEAAGQQPIVPNATFTPTAASNILPLEGAQPEDEVSSILELCLLSFLPLVMGIVVVKRRINS